MTVTCLSLVFTFNIHNGNHGIGSRGRKLTRLKSPFGRLLHLFLVPECDFNLGYQSAEEVANDLEPERKPATAFSREVAEVEEKNMKERNGSCLVRSGDATSDSAGGRPTIPSPKGRADNLDDHHELRSESESKSVGSNPPRRR